MRDKATVDAAFNRFPPPDLVIVYFGPGKDGQINKDTGGNPELNEIRVNAFQKGLMTGQQLDRVVEHEFAHWLQDAWLKANPGEMRGHGNVGNDYESDVYGGNPFIPDYSLFCRRLYGGNCT